MKKVIFLFGMVVSLVVVTPVHAQGPFNYFLRVEGIPGESIDRNHQGWIDVISFKEGVTFL